MKTKTKAVVFISILVLIFFTVACKKSGEAEKPVKADVAEVEAVAEAVAEIESGADAEAVDEVEDEIEAVEKE